jgi:hypothetical protein
MSKIKNKVDLSNYQEILSVSFDNDNAHLAVCHKAQGHSANGWHKSLMMKSDEAPLSVELVKALEQVEVKISFEEFLRRFMGLYYDDAELLTALLGYTTEEENYRVESEWYNDQDIADYKSYLSNKVAKFNLLKASALEDVPKDHLLELIDLQKTFEKNVMQRGISFKDSDETTNEVSEVITKTKSEINKEVKVDIQELLKSAEAQAAIEALVIEKAKVEIEKAKAELETDLQAKEQELLKASEELAAYREEKAKRVKDGFTNLIKSFSFIAEEDQEAVVAEMIKAKDSGAIDVKLLVAQFEKAKAEIEKAKADFVSQEDGIDVAEEQIDTEIAKSNADVEALAEMYAGKQWL